MKEEKRESGKDSEIHCNNYERGLTKCHPLKVSRQYSLVLLVNADRREGKALGS
jgi:hypothetical protein